MEHISNIEIGTIRGETCLDDNTGSFLRKPDLNGPDTVRGIQIGPDGWNIAHLNIQMFKDMTESESVDTVTVMIHGKSYGCICIRNGSEKDLPLSTVLRKKRRHLNPESKALTRGPVFVYLDEGLTDDDVILIGCGIVKIDGHSALMAEGIE